MANNIDVLVVGAGPAGLFAACELLRHGVRPRLVERRQAPHHEARGTALQPAVLEMLRRSGLVEPFLAAGVPVRQFQLLGPGLKEIARERFAVPGCGYDFQCSLPQWRTEEILRNHLKTQGVDVEFGTEVMSIDEQGDGLRVMLDVGGRAEPATAGYVLGAGGGHSVTRHSMAATLAGDTYDGQYLVADAKVRLDGPSDTARVVVGPTGFVLLAPLPEDRKLIFVNRDTSDIGLEPPTAETLGTLLNQRCGSDIGLNDLQWVSSFRMHKRVVERLGDGRRFLIGDAGHLSSPLGGEGLNAALMDAANIAWKLALVLRGHADPSLLATYAIERGLADRHAVEVSDEVHTTVMALVAACGQGETPALPSAPPEESLAALRRRLMLDVSYQGSPLVAKAPGQPSSGERFPANDRLEGIGHHLLVFGAVPGLDRLRARWNGLVSIIDGSRFDAMEAGAPEGGMVLVRPDGVIGFRAAPADEATMGILDAHLATYLVPNAAR